nr:hypothetical protein [Candidatus Freyarchaeota archaeon]
MPRRQSMGTAAMLTLVALIVFILSLALIFFAWNGIQGTANNALIIGLLIDPLWGLLWLYFAVMGGNLMMISLLFLGLGIILLLVAVLISRS